MADEELADTGIHLTKLTRGKLNYLYTILY